MIITHCCSETWAKTNQMASPKQTGIATFCFGLFFFCFGTYFLLNVKESASLPESSPDCIYVALKL